MKRPTVSVSLCLRALVSTFCLAMASYQMSQSINNYLSKPTATTIEKGSLRGAFPSIWVCRKPGINLTRLQELGYATLEDLQVGRWMGEGQLDWSANNSLDPTALFSEITRFEGESLLEGGIIAKLLDEKWNTFAKVKF